MLAEKEIQRMLKLTKSWLWDSEPLHSTEQRRSRAKVRPVRASPAGAVGPFPISKGDPMKLFRRLGALGRFLILAIVCVAGSPALCQTSPSNPLTATLVDSSGNPVSYTNVVTVQPNLTNATFSNSGAFDQLLGNSGDVSEIGRAHV